MTTGSSLARQNRALRKGKLLNQAHFSTTAKVFGRPERGRPPRCSFLSASEPRRLLEPVSNRASLAPLSLPPSLSPPLSLSLTLQGEATGLMSFSEECCRNPQEREREEREREGGCLHCNTQVLSQTQTRTNLFGMVSFLLQAGGRWGRV